MFRIIHGKGERMCPGDRSVPFSMQSLLPCSGPYRFAQMHLDWLESVVREGVERGQFKIGDQRPRDVAMQIAAGVQGALSDGAADRRPPRDRYGCCRTEELSGLREGRIEMLKLTYFDFQPIGGSHEQRD